MFADSMSRPAVIVGLGVLLTVGFLVGFTLIWGDGIAAVAYQWGLAGYREAPAKVVQTHTYYGRRSTTRQVVLDANGSRQTIRVHLSDLFNKLLPGDIVSERLVNDRVVAIRLGPEQVQIEDNMPWLIGLPAGVITGLLVIVMGIRAGTSKGFISTKALEQYQASVRGLPEGLMFLAAAALCLSAVSISVVEWVTRGVPPFPVVAFVIAAFTVVGAGYAIRMGRMKRGLAGTGLLPSSEALITALILPAKNGQWDVSFIGDGRLPRDVTLSTLDEAAVSQIETLIAHTYESRPVDVSFAWYPWESKSRGRGEFMVFMTQQKQDEYVATLDGRSEITASSKTFAGLSTAIETALAARGMSQEQPLQACITWNRTLTTWGYVHPGPPHGSN
jgi:hypothetical protein